MAIRKHDFPFEKCKIKLSQCIKAIILIGLYFYTSILVYEGPVFSWSRNSTVIRKNNLNIKGTYV